jgi:single-strand DNA-binding protein
MLNYCVFQGRLTKDVEVKQIGQSATVGRFSIACQRNYKNREGERETDFIPVEVWNNDVEFVNKHFHKGDMIIIGGSLKVESYTDRDGNRRDSYAIVGHDFNFSGSKGDQQRQQQGQGYGQQNQNYGQQNQRYPQQGQAYGQQAQNYPPQNQGYTQQNLDNFYDAVNDDGLPFA